MPILSDCNTKERDAAAERFMRAPVKGGYGPPTTCSHWAGFLKAEVEHFTDVRGDFG